MAGNITDLLINMAKKKPWNEKPVFCFTSDIDWASEAVLKLFFDDLLSYNIIPTVFVTHASAVVDDLYHNRKIERGIHPNFLKGSSHGDSFEAVINTCRQFAPETRLYRSHRGFSSTDTNHLLKNEHGFLLSSNTVAILQQNLQPLLHESGLLEFPIFFEDGTHLYNELDPDINKYMENFTSPGIKIISFHPMNFVINPSSIGYMRNIKDTLSRADYNNLPGAGIEKYKNNKVGIRDLCIEILELAARFDVVQLGELYDIATK